VRVGFLHPTKRRVVEEFSPNLPVLDWYSGEAWTGRKYTALVVHAARKRIPFWCPFIVAEGLDG
jgi:hypothetical protein